MTARVKRDPRHDDCQYAVCGQPARGQVWPVKVTGMRLEQPIRACARHLDLAEHGGAVVSRDH